MNYKLRSLGRSGPPWRVEVISTPKWYAFWHKPSIETFWSTNGIIWHNETHCAKVVLADFHIMLQNFIWKVTYKPENLKKYESYTHG